jgi:hypothetical protein
MTGLNVSTLAPELARLAEVHATQKHWPKESAALARMFLTPMLTPPAPSAEQVTQAVTVYLASEERFFPKPGSLKALALRQRVATAYAIASESLEDRYKAWDFSDAAMAGKTACPVCGAYFGDQVVAFRPALGSNGAVYAQEICRWLIWHDHDAHMRAGVSYVGAPRSPSARALHEGKLDRDRALVAAAAEGVAKTGWSLDRVVRALAEGKELPAKPPSAEQLAAQLRRTATPPSAGEL